MEKTTPVSCSGSLSPAVTVRRALSGDKSILPEQLSDAAAQCVQALKDGTLALFGADASASLLDYDGPALGKRPTATLSAIDQLANVHPLFAQFCQECEQAAAAYNTSSPRLGFYFCELANDEGYGWQANWIRGDLGIYRDLFVDLSFLFLSPKAEHSVAFGTYCNHGCSSPLGIKTPFFMDHSWLDITAFARHNTDEKSRKESQKLSARAFAGKRPFPCPFCGHQFVKGGLLGRKCPDCQKVLPKN